MSPNEIIEYLKPLLELSALILGLINGLILLWNYSRDRPKLMVQTIENSFIQSFFSLPDGEYQEKRTRKYGFLIDLEIVNCGLRDVQISSWSLKIKLINQTNVELKHLSIINPEIDFGIGVKTLPILGIRSSLFSGDTLVKSGQSIVGLAYYNYECYGDEGWDPLIIDGKIQGKIIVTDVFRKKSNSSFPIIKQELDFIKQFFKDIEKTK
jgi:hypothetical protein